MSALSMLALMFILALWTYASHEQAITCTAGHFALGQTATVTCNFSQDVTTSGYHLFVGWQPFSGSTVSKEEKALTCHKSSYDELICNPADGFRLDSVIRDHLTLWIPDVTARFAGRYTCHHVPKHGKRTVSCDLRIGDAPSTSTSTSRRTEPQTTNTPECTTERDLATLFQTTNAPESIGETDFKTTVHVPQYTTTVTPFPMSTGFFVLFGAIGGVVLLLVIFAVVVTVVLAVLSRRKGRTRHVPSRVSYLRDIRRLSADDVVFRRMPLPPKSDSDSSSSATTSHYAEIADVEGTSQNLPPPPRPHNVRRLRAEAVISLPAPPALQNESDSISFATSSHYDDIDDSGESTLSHLSEIYFDSSTTSESAVSDYYLHPVGSSCEATHPAAITTVTVTTVTVAAAAQESTPPDSIASASDAYLRPVASPEETSGNVGPLIATETSGTTSVPI